MRNCSPYLQALGPLVHACAPPPLHSIRAYAPASGAVDLLAGSGAEPSPEIVVNNAAPASVGISGMASLAWRNGTLWVGTNSLLHAIDLAANMLTTVSGDGTAGWVVRCATGLLSHKRPVRGAPWRGASRHGRRL
jgi:hypothetical protein